MKNEIRTRNIEVKGRKICVIEIPMAASGVQLVLATGDTSEIMSVGYLSFEGKVTWKFGKPSDEVVAAIEEELRKLFKCGEYW